MGVALFAAGAWGSDAEEQARSGRLGQPDPWIRTRRPCTCRQMRPCCSEGTLASEDDRVSSGFGVLMALAVGDDAMMLSHATATGVPGYHQRIRVTAAAAGQ
ncbi:hypothetical protein GCM10027610_073320 [Dactylosporangium cerinum]